MMDVDGRPEEEGMKGGGEPTANSKNRWNHTMPKSGSDRIGNGDERMETNRRRKVSKIQMNRMYGVIIRTEYVLRTLGMARCMSKVCTMYVVR